ncbi:MAG: hypothetical protein AABY22_09140 [Nanoarchaeota archaeon]
MKINEHFNEGSLYKLIRIKTLTRVEKIHVRVTDEIKEDEILLCNKSSDQELIFFRMNKNGFIKIDLLDSTIETEYYIRSKNLTFIPNKVAMLSHFENEKHLYCTICTTEIK